MNTITATDTPVELKTLAWDGRPKVVALHGDANDFVWSLEMSTDAGASWVAAADGDNNTSFTGCKPVQYWECEETLYRVNISNLGTATTVNVVEN